MNIFKKVWQTIDGSKTEIGGALLFIGVNLPSLFPQTAPICESLVVVASWFTGGALLHKAQKAVPNAYLPKGFKTRLDPNKKEVGQIPPMEGGN